MASQNLNADTAGERGDGRSLDPGRLLAARSEGVNLSPNLMNSMQADQEHRLHTASTRVSPQDRRSTPNPGYDPWIASSDGILAFRLRFATAMPAAGATLRAHDAVPAGAAPEIERASADASRATRVLRLGAEPRPAAGIEGGTGRNTRTAGPGATGHASIELGRASTTSDLAELRPRDNIDAEALATTLLRNSIATTIHAGPERATGIGGVGGGGAPGSGGGIGVGGRARPYGEGNGWLSLASPDGRYLRYFQDVRRHLDPLWADAFPRSEQLRLRQGTVILRFVIEGNGHIRDVSVLRRSGVDTFDHNVVSAIANATLPPIPPELGRSEIHITAPFVFRNPIVR